MTRSICWCASDPWGSPEVGVLAMIMLEAAIEESALCSARSARLAPGASNVGRSLEGGDLQRGLVNIGCHVLNISPLFYFSSRKTLVTQRLNIGVSGYVPARER